MQPASTCAVLSWCKSTSRGKSQSLKALIFWSYPLRITKLQNVSPKKGSEAVMIIPRNEQSSKSHPPATIKTSAIKPLPDFKRPQRSPGSLRASDLHPAAPSCSTDVAQAADDRFKLLLGIWLGLNALKNRIGAVKNRPCHIGLSFYPSIYARYTICISIYLYINMCTVTDAARQAFWRMRWDHAMGFWSYGLTRMCVQPKVDWLYTTFGL